MGLCDLRQIGPDVSQATRDTLPLTDDVAIVLTETRARAKGWSRGGVVRGRLAGGLIQEPASRLVRGLGAPRARAGAPAFLHALDTQTHRLADDGRYTTAIDAGLTSVWVEKLREST